MSKKAQKSKTELKLQIAEMETLLKRVQADFDNYRKRTLKEREEFVGRANLNLIYQILPVLDNFKMALKHLPKALEENEWVKGILQIERQLEQILTEQGLEKIKTVGERFDHQIHEAIEEVPSTKPPGEIIEEVQGGYRLNGQIIRQAKVKISKGKRLSKKSQN